jgi:hypothetical protein
MIKVIDDAIPKRYQTEIIEKLFRPAFKWGYSPTIVNHKTGEGFAYGFCNPLGNYSQGIVDSENFHFLLPLIYCISEKSGVDFESILAARSFLQVPSNYEEKYGHFHVDFTFPHLVFLYYVNDSDGDTVISKKKYDYVTSTLEEIDESLILERVTPKQGRVVIFDGMYYHAGGIPKNNPRCVINFDLSVSKNMNFVNYLQG